MREGLVKQLMQATCNTAMLFDFTMAEGKDASIIRNIIEEFEAKPWVVRKP